MNAIASQTQMSVGSVAFPGNRFAPMPGVNARFQEVAMFLKSLGVIWCWWMRSMLIPGRLELDLRESRKPGHVVLPGR
jgi:hypothetical protein